MISYDFEYYKPSSVEEAISLFQSLDGQGKEPIYFSGGTEIITLGRANQIKTGAVIDIKSIPECLTLTKEKGKITFGVAQALNTIRDTQYFPFLGKAIAEIADHTARNKITLGGNMCANIIYRESILPLLLTNSQLVVAGPAGLKQVPINEIFDQKLKFQRGELLVQVIIDEKEIKNPFLCIKKRKHWDVGYPLVTVAAAKKSDGIKFAFSGLCSFPFRSEKMEESLNNKSFSNEVKIEEAMEYIPAPVLSDVHSSEDYRIFVLKNTLLDVLDTMRRVENV
jgi:CO/xanthine dehydrogenase FAD-binding subunit